MENGKPYVSVVVPVYNEEGNVVELHRRIREACEKIGRLFEIILVDDGSTDKTVELCRGLSPLTLIGFRRNFGQTAAFDAGIKRATGDIVITMDGDLQNDPADIPLLLAEMDKGFDIVSGWRHKRKDTLMKRFFSRGANLLRKGLVKDGIHDSGCSLKAYRRECFDGVDLFGEMHRFMPALLQLDGFRVSEVKVSHHPRIHGVTKYNWKRAIKGFVDMLFIWFWRKYSHRAIHLFGGTGLVLGLVGIGLLGWMFVEKVFFGASLSERIWPLVGTLLVLVGVQLFIFGILVDVSVKTYYSQRGRMNYSVKQITNNS
ncbi:MAG: glycosyltransferase family 2 protein [Candidatus Moranbacteria bacterium]|nr:glycosyltransferase family 2 protein [Candidatus Moranbacteria bacterium]